MKNFNSRFDSIKSYVPNLLSSSKERVSDLITLMTQIESDYLTKFENTDSDIKELLKSKMEMEIILGLKFLTIHILKGKDISTFYSDIINLFLCNNILIKKLCLNLIDFIALDKCELLMLLYNSKVSDTDPLQRWTAIHLITALKMQSISLECSKHLIPLFNDSNPIIRRLALVSLVQYIKNNSKDNSNLSLNEEDFISILLKYFSDPHPLVFSTAFYAICELKNKDYLSLNIPQYFVYYCDNLCKVDDFYLERVVFSLVNFTKLFILNNLDKNHIYFSKLFSSLYELSKYSTNNMKILSCLNGIYELINSLEGLQLNSISKEDYQLFKNGKQLVKLGKLLIKTVICSKNDQEKYQFLELISNFLNPISISKSNDKNYNYPFFKEILTHIEKNFSSFFLQIGEKEFISIKKLEIIVNLTNESNVKTILDEFKRNLNYPNQNLKKIIIKTIYHICKINSLHKSLINKNISVNIPSLCIEKLIDLLKLKEEGVISQIIICLRKLILEIKDQTKFVLIYNIKNYKKNVTSSIAKGNIIWMISQYIHIIPTVSVDFFRRLLIEIDIESDEVKSQILGFALRVNSELNLILGKYDQDIRESNLNRIKNLIKYSTEKLIWDKNYNIREKARMVDFMVNNNIFDKKLDFLANYIETNLAVNEFEMGGNKYCKSFLISLVSKLSDSETEKNISIYNKKFVFDSLDKNVDPNFYKITLDDIINLKKTESLEKNEPKSVLNNDKYISVKKQGNVNESVQNFDSGINVEEMKAKMKNQLDDFLNKDEDDEDDYEVEIKRD